MWIAFLPYFPHKIKLWVYLTHIPERRRSLCKIELSRPPRATTTGVVIIVIVVVVLGPLRLLK